MEQAWSGIVKLYYANPEGWFLALGVLVASAILWPWDKTRLEWLENTIPKRRGRMLRRARREFIKKQAVDDFVDRVEERFFQGIYTDAERKELYRDIKKCFPIRDVFPSPELLKEAINKRRALGIHNPVPLPDWKEKARPKHMFEKPAKA